MADRLAGLGQAVPSATSAVQQPVAGGGVLRAARTWRTSRWPRQCRPPSGPRARSGHRRRWSAGVIADSPSRGGSRGCSSPWRRTVSSTRLPALRRHGAGSPGSGRRRRPRLAVHGEAAVGVAVVREPRSAPRSRAPRPGRPCGWSRSALDVGPSFSPWIAITSAPARAEASVRPPAPRPVAQSTTPQAVEWRCGVEQVARRTGSQASGLSLTHRSRRRWAGRRQVPTVLSRSPPRHSSGSLTPPRAWPLSGIGFWRRDHDADVGVVADRPGVLRQAVGTGRAGTAVGRGQAGVTAASSISCRSQIAAETATPVWSGRTSASPSCGATDRARG